MAVIELQDPWRSGAPSPDREAIDGPRLVVAWLVGTIPYAIAVVGHGESQRQAAIALLVAGAIALASTHRRLPRASAVAGMVVSATLAATAVAPVIGWRTVVVSAAVLALAVVPTTAPLPRQPTGLRLIALAAAGLAWWRLGSVRLTVVALLGAAAAIALEHTRPQVAATADHQLGRAIRGVAEGAGHLVIGLIALPFLYLPTLVATPWRRWKRRHRARLGTTWIDRRIDPVDDAREVHQPFAPAPARTRRARNVMGAAAVLVAVALVWREVREVEAHTPERGAIRTVPVPTQPSSEDTDAQDEPAAEVPLRDRPAMAGAEWADDLEQELQDFGAGISLDPTTGNVAEDHAGEYVNVQSGIRRSAEPDCPGCPEVDLWLVGGSAAFGWHQRDDRSLASAISEVGAEKGLAVRVTNLAMPGWTLADERGAVERALDGGATPPDMVVFYDGFNDLVGALAEAGTTGQLSGDRPNRLDPEQLSRYSADGGSLDGLGGAAGVAAVASNRYREEAGAAALSLSNRGVRVRHVLQPDAFTSTVQLDGLEPVTGYESATMLATDLASALDAFEGGLGDLAFDARHALADLEEPVFTDVPHTNERGARRSAEVLLDELEQDLRRLAD